MMRLLSSEWERLWKRKTAWLFLIAIPVILAGTAKYYLGHNAGVAPGSPEYTTAENFPVMAMIEQLIVVFNVWALVLLTLSFTEEYRSGQLRMVMLRAYSRTQLFAAKWLAFALMTALFFLVYLLAAAAVGRLVFPPSSEQILFYHDQAVASGDMLRYTLGYYGLAYATILGTSSVFLAVAVVSRTSTAAIGLGMGYLLVSLAYPVLFELANRVLAWDLPGKLKFLSLTEIQHSGIAVMLGDAQALPSGELGLWMTGILAGSMAVFLAGAGMLFTKPDRWT